MNEVLGNLISPVQQVRCGDSTYPVLSMTMHDGIVLQNDRFKKKIASADLSNYKIVNRGQLVVGFPINEGVIYPQKIVDIGIMSPAYNVWDIDQSKVDIDYLDFCLHSPASMHYYASKLRGSTARRRSMPKEHLLELPVYLPPINEQHRIATTLKKIQSLVAARREQILVLDKLAKDMFVDMFSDPVVNEKRFDNVLLGTLGEFKNGMNYSQSDSGHEVRCLGVGDFGALYEINDVTTLSCIQLSTAPSESYYLKGGDIVFVRSNGNKALVGRSVEITAGNNEIVFSGFCIRFRIQSEIILPKYLNHALHMNSLRNALFRTTRGANIQNLNQQMLSRLVIPIPPIQSQIDFDDRVRALSNQKSRLTASLAELEALYQSLTERAFSGELFPQTVSVNNP